MNSSGTITATNTYGLAGLISRHTSSGSTFYEFDPQGTVVQRLNSAGSNTITSTADAFGNVASSGTVSDTFGYEAQAGYYTDQSTGLILTTFRYYDPINGRFLNRDPIGNLGGINIYEYCQNQPVDRQDPSGLLLEWSIGFGFFGGLLFFGGGFDWTVNISLEGIGISWDGDAGVGLGLGGAYGIEGGFSPAGNATDTGSFEFAGVNAFAGDGVGADVAVNCPMTGGSSSPVVGFPSFTGAKGPVAVGGGGFLTVGGGYSKGWTWSTVATYVWHKITAPFHFRSENQIMNLIYNICGVLAIPSMLYGFVVGRKYGSQPRFENMQSVLSRFWLVRWLLSFLWACSVALITVGLANLLKLHHLAILFAIPEGFLIGFCPGYLGLWGIRIF
jgi:RHS repeat-associated protein